MALDEKTVKKVAQLARIKVAAARLPGLAGELNAMVAFVEQLNEVDTSNVAPISSVGFNLGGGETMPMRDDVVTEIARPMDILANAPDKDKSFFLVPKVVE